MLDSQNRVSPAFVSRRHRTRPTGVGLELLVGGLEGGAEGKDLLDIHLRCPPGGCDPRPLGVDPAAKRDPVPARPQASQHRRPAAGTGDGHHRAGSWLACSQADRDGPAVAVAVDPDPIAIDHLMGSEPGEGVERVIHPSARIDPARLPLAVAVPGVVEPKRREALCTEAGGNLRQDQMLDAGEPLTENDPRHRRGCGGAFGKVQDPGERRAAVGVEGRRARSSGAGLTQRARQDSNL